MNTFIRLAVLHACAAAAGAASHPHIDERATTLEFRPRSVVLSLAIGGISEPLVGHVRAQWLDPFDRIVATGAAKENLHTGQNSVVLAMPSPTAKLAADRHSDLVWHRIRWYVRIPAQGISSKGVLAVSELKSNLFTLQVLTPSEAAGLRGIPVLVRAVHPVSERPVAGVAVQASFKRSKGSEITAVTDSSGLARVTLHPPAVASDDESDDENIEIRARIGEFEQVATQAAEIDRHAEIRISTDKAIYQPGQTVRIRGIAMGPDGHVLPATTVQIAISAERRRKLMDITTTSSRYGIIAAEWTLPDNAETGRYSVEATIREGLFQGSRNWISVDVSRYELPHFTLQVTTDRSWYLPGQPAVVSVGASYLFGKPVHKGEVVITERLRPRWDAKRRESEQPEVQSGRTSLAAGRAEIRFTPRTPFGDGGYSAEIREYTVKVTDTSGRTEEQTFSLTLSSEALRVELLGANRLSTQLPMPLYIRTSYPDGKACAAQVRVQLRSDGRSIEIGTVHTGPSGVASFDDFSLAPSSSEKYDLTALASDGQGGTGHSSVSVERNESGIRVIPTRHLYRAGEPVTLRIRSVKDSDVVYIAALRGTAVLDFQLVEIRGRAALITFPFREDFKGKIAFQVHRRATTFDRGIEDALDETAVFFQVKPALNVHVKTDQTQYRPGGLVRAEVTLAGSDGRPITGAVGFTVIDKAVEQRANSIRDGRFWLTSRRRHDDLAAGWPTNQGSELAAAAAAAEHQTNYPVLFPSLFVFRTAELYRERVSRDMAPLRAALDRWGKAGKPYPTHTGGLQAVLSGYGVKTGALRDPWDTTYNLRIATEHEWMRIEALSAGPDREFDTSDDLSVIQLSWRWFDRASRRIANVLRLAAVFPRTEQEFRELMRPGELAALLKDPAGNPLTVRVTTTKLAVSDTNVYEYDEYAMRPPARGTAVAQLIKVPVVTLLSKQAGERGGAGEFTLASFTGPPTSDVMARLLKKPRVSAIANRSYRGGVRGTVVDFTEAAIPNALIEATSTVSKVVYSTRTDSEGRFVAFLPPGSWTVRVSSPGLMLFAATGVPVVQGILTGLNVQLQLGSVSELIAVQAEPAPLMTSSAMVAAMFKKASPPPPAAPPGGVVRQYFPETLVWLPLLETAGDGRVPVDFKLADNITTWSLKAVGSTTEGEIETVSSEVRSFLPLFIDYDPPSMLTAGDEITLTAQTRNYLEQEQTVSVLAQGADGITVSSAAQSSLRVAAGDASTVAFRVAAGRPSRRAASRISIKLATTYRMQLNAAFRYALTADAFNKSRIR